MKVRTGGSAGAWNNDRNFLTFLPQGHPGHHRLAPTRCTPPRDAENGPLNSGAGPLATTRIIERTRQPPPQSSDRPTPRTELPSPCQPT